MSKEKLVKLLIIVFIFLVFYFTPFQSDRIKGAVLESLLMLQEYTRHHILLCLVPAFLIAGGIAVFLSKEAVLKYFGPKTPKYLSYSVASVSGTILSVCSCTILPLFGGIYYRGAGLGPGMTFLYSGPAINVLAIVLTARVLGWQIGLARALGAIFMGIVIGLLMHLIFIKEEQQRAEGNGEFITSENEERSLLKNGIFFFSLIAILVFLNWGEPVSLIVKTTDGNIVSGTRVLTDESKLVLKTENNEEISIPKNQISSLNYPENLYSTIFRYRFHISGVFLILLLIILFLWFDKQDLKEWMNSSWDLSMQLLPLLFIGVLVAGFALGRPGKEALIPSSWIAYLVGGNSIWANFFASIAAALMYFATLTEVPILQGLIGAGMGKGPALSLLLAGPAVSLPSMLVLRQIFGWKKMLVYIALVVLFSTLFGFLFGLIV